MGDCLNSGFFDTFEELKGYLGVGHVVPSKLALITKFKPDGSLGHWDFDLLFCIFLLEWLVLPRLEDAVEDGKHLLRVHGAMEWLVVDAAHAFHNTPVRPSEFMCGNVGTRFFVFKVLGMGDWFAAATGRVVSSVSSGDAFRCYFFVDDLLLAGGGSLGERWRTFTVALGTAVVGFSSLRALPVSVTGWCGSSPSSQLKTSASQWRIQRTPLMPCTARRPGSCRPQLHKRSDNSAASFLCWYGPNAATFAGMVWAAFPSKS